MAATITLEPDVPNRTKDILTTLPGIDVLPDQEQTTLRVNGWTRSLTLVSGGLAPLARATAPMLAALSGDNLGFVVAERLAEHVRSELEKAGCAYADASGAAHIDVPGLYLHTDGRPRQRRTLAPTPPGIGVVAVRTIQALLANPDHTWDARDLAHSAACSLGEAHRVLNRLQHENLISAHRIGRTLRRTIPNPGELLDWLATVPSARRIRERQYAYLYESDPGKLSTSISAYAFQNHLHYAFTGIAAAHMWGAKVTTSIPVTMLRIAPDVPLSEATSMLQAEPVDSGANLLLVRDLGEVGTHGRQFNGPAPLAPPVRVWLDMLDEQRGEDAAALFREAVIGW